ncbi:MULTISPECIES: hypothetical protein [unclassified Nocardioides]|uniref:hypothetical protein n=1 Tax=unclassified Nocardioides TaxID=2615069 RepID=UPI0009F12BBE|nr:MULTISPECIES: hypothetical protein [unclassified Nocardioides]GAW48615.1 Membrane protein-like protein (Precursor) [Nocardioides sp. PD653-B2]GAW54286.1 Membrane protein-like protein (Precursor) [Nocardioides sp. PD653]
MPRRDERGAVVPLVAILLTTLLGVTALTVDIGVQRVARADMQALADVVALDLARELDGRAASAILPGLQAAADRSLARNADTAGDAASVEPELGTLDGATFVPAGGATVPDAVRVTATTSVDFSFRPGSGGAGRTAVAAASPVACFALGSYSARASSGDSTLLTTYLGKALGLSGTVGGYSGLAAVDVRLADLASELDAGTVDELLATGLTVKELYVAIAHVLQRNGDTAAATLLQSVQAAVGVNPSLTIDRIVAMKSGDDAALLSTVNVLDLVVAAAHVATGGNFVTLPLTTEVPGLTGASLDLQVVERPQIACGRAAETVARTSQVTAVLTGTNTAALTLPDVASASMTSTVTVRLSLADATGTMTSTVCGDGTATSPASITVQVATPSSPASVDAGVTASLATTALAGPPMTVALDPVTLHGSGTSTTQDVVIDVPPRAFDTAYAAHSNAVALPALSASDVSGPGMLSHATKAAVATVLGSLTTSVNDGLLSVLSADLGLHASGADVFALPTPSCAGVALRG